MKKITLILSLFFLLISAVHGRVIYVKADASGSNNGTSWANACTSLQTALGVVASGDEIWVARGTYKPSSGTDRTISFQMKNGVRISGGFAGSETNISQRINYSPGQVNETILSGNIGDQGVSTDNSYQVIRNPAGISGTAILDGVTITGGYADGAYPYFVGGGMFNNSSSPTISNCTFSSNSAINAGGGLFNYSGSAPSISNCTFTQNSAETGGGISNFDNSPSVITKGLPIIKFYI